MAVKANFQFNDISRLALETSHTKSIAIRACRMEQTYISISVLYLSTLDCDTNNVHHLAVLNFKQFDLYTYYLFNGDALEKGSVEHPVLSWLNEIALWGDDLHSQCIFLCTAFIVAYAQDLDDELRISEILSISQLITKLINPDTESVLYDIVWQKFSSSIDDKRCIKVTINFFKRRYILRKQIVHEGSTWLSSVYCE